MKNVLKINFGKRRLASVLGLALDGTRLEGVVLRRANGALQQHQSFSVTLSLDPLTAAPELVGREIRNHLDAAGVRERHCVVGVPLKWVLAGHTEVPPLPAADAASFLELEAERGFPCDVATLRLGTSRCPLPEGRQYTMLAGIPNSHLALLEQALQAARLKPVSFALGLTALQFPKDAAAGGVLALAAGESQVSMQLTCGGGVAALRALEGAVEIEAGRRLLQSDLVVREARITMGQLPPALRDTIRRVRIFGPRELAQQLADEMELRFEPMGLTVEIVTAYSPDEFGIPLPPETPVSMAFSLAARLLAGQPPVFEFLPPKPTIVEQFAAKYSSGRLRTVSAAAAGVLVIIGGLFLFQEWQLMRLRSQWSAMSAKVQELNTLQDEIRQYRPWFDDSFRSLNILKQLTAAFPEDGVVSARTLEIQEGNVVSCSGVARDNAALLRTLGQLRGSDGVTDLKVDQIRGKSPLQFTFDFHWGRGGGNEN